MNETVTCKSCKHCKFNWKDIFSWGSEYAYVCKKTQTDEWSITDPVTGRVKVLKNYMCSCSSERSKYSGKCGEDGKLWEPKYKKDLFTYIKRI